MGTSDAENRRLAGRRRGYGVKEVADAWAAASGPDREMKLLVGEALLGVTGGLFLNFIAWLMGLPYLLMGLAVARDDGYPAWLGWAAVAAGAGALFSGTTRFLGIEIVPFPVLYGAFVVPLTLWLAAVGLLMWRRAVPAGGRIPPDAPLRRRADRARSRRSRG